MIRYSLRHSSGADNIGNESEWIKIIDASTQNWSLKSNWNQGNNKDEKYDYSMSWRKGLNQRQEKPTFIITANSFFFSV